MPKSIQFYRFYPWIGDGRRHQRTIAVVVQQYGVTLALASDRLSPHYYIYCSAEIVCTP
jgi:hypothetical protein